MAQKKEKQEAIMLCYNQFLIYKTKPLGNGSYGAVYKAKCDQLPCAAKVLHPTILDPQDPGSDRIMKRFQQECAFLNKIRHPHIVMYLGMTRDPESKLPVLLMELLDESLTKLLGRSKQPLPYNVQIDLSHDIALAIAYLHSNDIIHRDLSSNNVLIIAGRRAKVTDFGMSKLMSNTTSTLTPLTMCPGTQAYMPPEALKEPPTYTQKLDCFSEGVIMIQICTQLWPMPGPRTHNVAYPKSPTGSIEMPVLETERRKNHIELIAPNHPLLPIAIDCLSYGKDDRPSGEELCQRFAELKETERYSESVLACQMESGQITLEKIIHQIREAKREEKSSEEEELQREIERLKEEVKSLKRKSVLEKIEHNSQKSKNLEERPKMKNKLRPQISLEAIETRKGKELFSQLNLSPRTGMRPSQSLSQLSESSTHQLSPSKASGYSSTQMLSYRPRQSPARPPPPPVPSPRFHKRRFSDQPIGNDNDRMEKMTGSLDYSRITLIWREGVRTPKPLSRGAAAVDNDKVYVVDSKNSVYYYSLSVQKWSELPNCPLYGSCLAIVNGIVTAIGGTTNYKRSSNKLLSLKEEHKSKTQKWMECFPAMPTEKWNAAATISEKSKYLIVVGGERARKKLLNAVEVLNTKTLIWSVAAALPNACTNPSVAICGDRVLVLGGGEDHDDGSNTAMSCSLTKLTSDMASSSKKVSTWQKIANVPAHYSTCAVVDGELLAVGGQDVDGKSTTAVYKYNPILDRWDYSSYMLTARYNSVTAVVSAKQQGRANELMVIGGCTNDAAETNTVDSAFFN